MSSGWATAVTIVSLVLGLGGIVLALYSVVYARRTFRESSQQLLDIARNVEDASFFLIRAVRPNAMIYVDLDENRDPCRYRLVDEFGRRSLYTPEHTGDRILGTKGTKAGSRPIAPGEIEALLSSEDRP